ncbi:DNA-binding response regulator [Methylacidiphilum sp. Yel]|jgi:DNA-binding response OmpR family regulator|uniref:response regulator transcription factor n=1 Tax=Methylacidiphilum sp. Yel TaxID=1847730 RepID=UPI0010690DA3|nr:response regulator transcription factor [Methylacidiphilum sp. Yel]TFE67803.1 DNA-binding response regulator [Methylacidiphilum sp. Yel]
MKILIVEDDQKVRKHVKGALQAEGYSVEECEDGEEAQWLLENYSYDLAILDLMLPEKDGIGIVKQIRRKGISLPILFLSGRAEVSDRVHGLDAGADDYLTKPFSTLELLARVRALLRRRSPITPSVLKFEDLEMDLTRRTVSRAGQSIELTNREFELLRLLLESAPNPVNKAVITEKIWDRCFDSETALVNVHINHLRQKIHLPGLPPLLHTIRGVGFILKHPTDK